ncbi:MAG: SpoIID/LytB domain-containing protein [Planctomycetia bacterium]|nr:SpoIID/LytB domain-containing protein [Planctomycetia bacterium]MCC7314828.1 SpoIID/LytB domain-containing protein [Planctomycetota bacterium]
MIKGAGPAATLGIFLASFTLLFVGCLSLTESPFWHSPAREEKPIEPVVMDRLIRVRLFGRKPHPSKKMSVTAPFTVIETSTGNPVAEAMQPINGATIRPAAGTGLELGDRRFASDDILITPSRDAALVIDDKTYRGALRVQRSGAGLTFTNHVDIESYLRGVLRGELPRYFHIESFKAQCVAARTYALYTKRFKPAGSTFDVYDDEGSQVYSGVSVEDATSARAVDETRGEVCSYDNAGKQDIFCTYYSSCCGGLSQHVNNVKPRDPNVPPLAGGVVCRDCFVAPRYRWDPVTISRAELTRKIVARYPTLKRLGMIVDVKSHKMNDAGRHITIDLVGSGGDQETLIAEDFRLSIGGRLLKSTNFKIEKTKDGFRFTDGKGFGHGMGLCQYGMETKARQGMGYRQILATYYPHSTIQKIYD